MYRQVVGARRTRTRLEAVVRSAPHGERSMVPVKYDGTVDHSLS